MVPGALIALQPTTAIKAQPARRLLTFTARDLSGGNYGGVGYMQSPPLQNTLDQYGQCGYRNVHPILNYGRNVWYLKPVKIRVAIWAIRFIIGLQLTQR